jgi:integrase
LSLMKRGAVYWSFYYIDGIRYQQSTGTSNRRRAAEIENKLIEDANLKRFHLREYEPELKFGALAARFIANAKVRIHHLDRLKKLLPYYSETPIGRITRASADEYRRERHAHSNVTETTINRDIEVLRHILYWAVDAGILLTNPLSRVRLERERRKPRTVLTVAEEEALLAVAPPHLQEIIVAALDTGMRRGELLNQLWEHVDFDRRLLSVSKSKTAGGEGRELPLTRRLFELLWKRRQASGLVFTFHKHQIFAIKTAWKTATSRSLTRHVRFHDLRHTHNTRLMESGTIQDVRKALMGHSNGEEVNSIYTHVEMGVRRKAIEQLEIWHAAQIEALRGPQVDTEPQPGHTTSQSNSETTTIRIVLDASKPRASS